MREDENVMKSGIREKSDAAPSLLLRNINAWASGEMTKCDGIVEFQ